MSHTILSQINSTFSRRMLKSPPVMPGIAVLPSKTLTLSPRLVTAPATKGSLGLSVPYRMQVKSLNRQSYVIEELSFAVGRPQLKLNLPANILNL